MKKYIVRLIGAERDELHSIIKDEKSNYEKRQRARILLKANQSDVAKWMTDEEISKALDVSVPTVERTRRRLVEEGFEACLDRGKRSGIPHNLKVDGELEAQILMLACSVPPSGRSRWTLNLMGDHLVKLELVDTISRETIRKTLKKTKSSHGKKSNGA